jgi:hypothetical protein
MFWGARASRVLVSASRRNNLTEDIFSWGRMIRHTEVRDSEDAIASPRDGCATQSSCNKSPLTMLLFFKC